MRRSRSLLSWVVTSAVTLVAGSGIVAVTSHPATAPRAPSVASTPSTATTAPHPSATAPPTTIVTYRGEGGDGGGDGANVPSGAAPYVGADN